MTVTKLALSATMALAVLAVPVEANAEDDPKVLKDLGTVIALQGKPCGKVTRADKQAENDYVVTCSSGDRYRVRISSDDRVEITPL